MIEAFAEILWKRLQNDVFGVDLVAVVMPFVQGYFGYLEHDLPRCEMLEFC